MFEQADSFTIKGVAAACDFGDICYKADAIGLSGTNVVDDQAVVIEIKGSASSNSISMWEEIGGHINRALLRGRQGEAIARAGIDLNNLAGDFVVLLQDQPREVGRIL